MSEIRCALEVREDTTREHAGILTGTLLTYGERASDRPEQFEAGALSWPADGVVLREQHDRKQPLARFTPTVEGNEVRVAIPLPDTQRSRDALTNVRAGVFRGLSVEFRAVSERYEAGVRVITAAALGGAGLVDDPSYKGSRVEVRDKRTRRRRVWL